MFSCQTILHSLLFTLIMIDDIENSYYTIEIVLSNKEIIELVMKK